MMLPKLPFVGAVALVTAVLAQQSPSENIPQGTITTDKKIVIQALS
jgi:hypothetical protein